MVGGSNPLILTKMGIKVLKEECPKCRRSTYGGPLIDNVIYLECYVCGYKDEEKLNALLVERTERSATNAEKEVQFLCGVP